MSRKKPRPRYAGTEVTMEFDGHVYLDNNQHIPTLAHALGVEVEGDSGRPDVKPDGKYRMVLLFVEVDSERSRA